jgi:predicted enzyme related to lactoylglutathione lyase
MAFESRIVWNDLSTYDVEEAKRFYQMTFQWDFQEDRSVGEPYLIAQYGGQSIAGIYLLPKQFRMKRFPSFWMPYIHVTNIWDTVREAKQFGGAKVEIRPMDLGEGNLIALVRDPLGAGFTLYQGEGSGKQPTPSHGLVMRNELHISSLAKVKTFYEHLFGWQILPTEHANIFSITLRSGNMLGHVLELPNHLRGNYQYWIPMFKVNDVASYVERVLDTGGTTAESFWNDQTMIQDSQGASFIVST